MLFSLSDLLIYSNNRLLLQEKYIYIRIFLFICLLYKSSGGIRTVIKKKTTSRGLAKTTVYKVAASYIGKFKTATDAKTAHSKISSNPNAQVTPVKKTAQGYSFGVKFTFVTPSVKVRDQAIKGAKAQGAKVTASAMKI